MDTQVGIPQSLEMCRPGVLKRWQAITYPQTQQKVHATRLGTKTDKAVKTVNSTFAGTESELENTAYYSII